MGCMRSPMRPSPVQVKYGGDGRRAEGVVGPRSFVEVRRRMERIRQGDPSPMSCSSSKRLMEQLRDPQRQAPLRSRSTLLAMGYRYSDPSGLFRTVDGIPGETVFRKTFSNLDLGAVAPPASEKPARPGSRSSHVPQTLV
jgi:hypothetical protein